MPLTSTPNASDVISATQPIIKDNFDQLITWMPINHVDSDLSNEGWHKNLTFPVALATANPALASTAQIAVLPFTGVTSLVCELAVQKFGGSPVAFTEGLNSTAGYARLGSGLLLKWGTATGLSGAGTITHNSGSTPNFTAIYSCQLSTIGTGGAISDTMVYLLSISGTTVNVYGSARTTVAAASTSYSWLLLGV